MTESWHTLSFKNICVNRTLKNYQGVRTLHNWYFHFQKTLRVILHFSNPQKVIFHEFNISAVIVNVLRSIVAFHSLSTNELLLKSSILIILFKLDYISREATLSFTFDLGFTSEHLDAFYPKLQHWKLLKTIIYVHAIFK